MRIYLTLPAIFLIVLSLSAQSVQKKALSKSIELEKISIPSDLSTEEYFTNYSEEFGLLAGNEMKPKLTFKDKSGWERHRFNQFYKGHKVIGGNYILHSKDGLIKKGTGIILPYIDLSIKPRFDKKQIGDIAFSQALDLLDEEDILGLSDLEIESIELAIMDKAFPHRSGHYLLVYDVVVSNLNQNPYHPFRERLYIDANSTKLVQNISEIAHKTVLGTAETKYHGTRVIATDSIGPNEYVLKDYSRGEGVVTVNDVPGFAHADFMDDDNHWNNVNLAQDEVATDVHFGAISFFDYLNTTFGWFGLDGEGGEMFAIVHAAEGGNFVNAFWTGSQAWFGDGDCDEYGPLTSLDVVGHEFAHGLTDFTSDLIYRNESGALNESLSDIFGKTLELIYDPANFSWYIGDRFLKAAGVRPFRSMQDPNERNDPKFYGGEYWHTSTSDNGGVHSNSGVLNYWFYMLVEGKVDTNEVGYVYNVQAIGLEKTMDIVFGVQAGYLTQTSNYVQMVSATIQETTDLYGANSPELAAVIEAWKAVGLTETAGDKDLMILVGQESLFACGNPDSIQVHADVINFGRTAYLTGETLDFRFEIADFESDIESTTLTEDIEPGDTLHFVFDQYAPLDPSQTLERLTVFLETPEESFVNNRNQAFVRTTGTGSDLELVVYIRRDVSDCSSGGQLILQPALRNTGCDLILDGTVVPTSFILEGVEYNLDLELVIDMDPGDVIFFNKTVDAPLNSLGVYMTSMEIFPPFNDTDPDNNRREEDLLVLGSLGEGYLEEFTNYNIDTDFYLAISSDFASEAHPVVVDGEDMLACTGDSSTPTSLEVCDIVDDFHDSNFGKTDIEFCLNVEGVLNPELHFDLIQYRSQYVGEPINQDYTASVIVHFEGVSQKSALIYNQPEGESVHHAIEIPEDYLGTVVIELLNLIGDPGAVVAGDFTSSDVNLIDNLEIRSSSVSIVEPDNPIKLLVYPNPATEVVTFNLDRFSPYFEVHIFDLMGRRIENLQGSGNSLNWNIPTGLSGLFLYEVVTKSSERRTGKLTLGIK
jgi:Zn-dependent metalloprotease